MEEEYIESLLQEYHTAKEEGKLKKNKTAWNEYLWKGNFGEVNLLPLHHWYFYFLEKFKHIEEFKNFHLKGINLHIWENGSGINWHNDNDTNGLKRIGATIYLNKEWDLNYGGLFLYKKDGDDRWYKPNYNECVWFKSPMDHAVSIISNNVPEPRLSVQLFFAKRISLDDIE